MLFTLDDRSKNLKESSANAIHAVKDKEDRLNRAFGDNVKGREDEQCEPMRTKGTNVDLLSRVLVLVYTVGQVGALLLCCQSKYWFSIPHSPHSHRTKVPCTVLLVMPSRLGSLATSRWLRFTNERIVSYSFVRSVQVTSRKSLPL
jgi:hypothetical protein